MIFPFYWNRRSQNRLRSGEAEKMSADFSSVSPIDGQTVWQGSSADQSEIAEVIGRAKAASESWRRCPVEERIARVRAYGEELDRRRDEITSLIVREVGKLGWDAAGEVNAAVAKVELSIKALHQRRIRSQLEGSSETVRRIVRYQPLGVALVLGPFNFPLHLPGGQIIPALLAGNTVVFKPSDQATAVGQWMTDAWQRSGLPSGVVEIIVGGVDQAVAAIDSSDIGGVFLTGSRSAGRAIHRQLVGRPGVLLALELGGNNPVVICDDVPDVSAARVVSFSAFISAGQRCTCARRAIFVNGPGTDRQVETLLRTTRQLRVGMPGDETSPQIGPVISLKEADRLRQTYDRLLSLGCKPMVPFDLDPRADNLVRPCVVDATELDAEAMVDLGEMEWFGPILVVQRADSFGEALRLAAETPYGLAASLLGGTESMFQQFVNEVGAGVVNWNGPTTGAAGALPFGGLGDSGNHRPAGFYAIDFCSDPIASLEHHRLSDSDPWSVAS